jgi:pre-mRNA-splicing factor 38B
MFRKHTNTVNQNVVQIWGNKESMNLNSMILTNIQTSNYYKQKLSELKTYHELIDEIYYRVSVVP